MMIPHYLTILSNTPPVDPLATILPWISTFVVAVIAAVFKMQAVQAKAMRVEGPVPEVPTRKVPRLMTWDDLQPLTERMSRNEAQALRMEVKMEEMIRTQGEQFRQILESGSAREERSRTHMDDIARALHSRMDEMMRDHSNQAPKPRAVR